MILRVPTYVILPRKTKADKKIQLNLNVYRNLSYIINNQCKAAFHKAFMPAIDNHKQKFTNSKLRFTYTIPAANKLKLDISHVLSIVDKLASNSIVKVG